MREGHREGSKRGQAEKRRSTAQIPLPYCKFAIRSLPPLSPRGPSDAAKQKNRAQREEEGPEIPPTEGFRGAGAMNEKASVSKELNAKHKKVALPPCRFFSAELS
jgi:hypothetical protein